QTLQLQRRLGDAVFTTRPVQSQPDTIETFPRQIQQAPAVDIDLLRVHALAHQCRVHCLAGIQRHRPFRRPAAHDHGDAAKGCGILHLHCVHACPPLCCRANCCTTVPMSPAPSVSSTSPPRTTS